MNPEPIDWSDQPGEHSTRASEYAGNPLAAALQSSHPKIAEILANESNDRLFNTKLEMLRRRVCDALDLPPDASDSTVLSAYRNRTRTRHDAITRIERDL